MKNKLLILASYGPKLENRASNTSLLYQMGKHLANGTNTNNLWLLTKKPKRGFPGLDFYETKTNAFYVSIFLQYLYNIHELVEKGAFENGSEKLAKAMDDCEYLYVSRHLNIELYLELLLEEIVNEVKRNLEEIKPGTKSVTGLKSLFKTSELKLVLDRLKSFVYANGGEIDGKIIHPKKGETGIEYEETVDDIVSELTTHIQVEMERAFENPYMKSGNDFIFKTPHAFDLLKPMLEDDSWVDQWEWKDSFTENQIRKAYDALKANGLWPTEDGSFLAKRLLLATFYQTLSIINSYLPKLLTNPDNVEITLKNNLGNEMKYNKEEVDGVVPFLAFL